MHKLKELFTKKSGDECNCPACQEDLPEPKVQLSIIQRKIDEMQARECLFVPGDIITTRKDQHAYRFPKHGDVAVVVEANIPRQLPNDGSPVERRDTIIAVLRGSKVCEYLVNSRDFEKLEIAE